jgi:Zn-dependent peptidase ImmA (M78 family)
LRAREAIPVARAREVLQALQLEEPDEIDPVAIAFHYDAAVQETPLDGMDGNIVRNGPKAVITVSSRIAYPCQKRFVIAHELGHFFLHPVTKQIETVDLSQFSDWSDRQSTEEYEANLFAAELLMPFSMFGLRIKGCDLASQQ